LGRAGVRGIPGSPRNKKMSGVPTNYDTPGPPT